MHMPYKSVKYSYDSAYLLILCVLGSVVVLIFLTVVAASTAYDTYLRNKAKRKTDDSITAHVYQNGGMKMVSTDQVDKVDEEIDVSIFQKTEPGMCNSYQ